MGFSNIKDGDSVAPICDAASNMMLPDLLMTDTQLPTGNMLGVISDIRRQKIGNNQFLPIVALTWKSAPDETRKAAEVGCNSILEKPFSAYDLTTQLEILISSKMHFEVNEDYVGPLRTGASCNQNQANFIEAPNIINLKATGTFDRKDYDQKVIYASKTVGLLRLKVSAAEISTLVDRVQPYLELGAQNEQMIALIDEISELTEFIRARLKGTRYAHVSDLCQSLSAIIVPIRSGEGETNPKDIKLLTPLSQALLLGFDDSNPLVMTSRQIQELVDSRYAS